MLFAPSHTYTNGGPSGARMSQNPFSGDTESINDAVKEAKDSREANVAIVRITGRTRIVPSGRRAKRSTARRWWRSIRRSAELCFQVHGLSGRCLTALSTHLRRPLRVITTRGASLSSAGRGSGSVRHVCRDGHHDDGQNHAETASIVSDETDDEDIVILDKPELFGAHGASNP